MRYCGECGAQATTGAAFCGNCGSRHPVEGGHPAEPPGDANAAPGTAGTRPVSQLGERWRRLSVPQAALLPAASVGLVALAVALTALTFLSAVLAALLPADGRGTPLEWIRSAVLLLAMAVRAPVRGEVAAEESLLSAQMELSAVAVPLTLTIALVLLVALVARRSRLTAVGGEPLTLLTLSLVAAAGFALVAAGAALLASGPVSALGEAGVRVELGVRPLWMLALSFLMVVPAVLVGVLSRGSERSLRRQLLERTGAWGRDVHAGFLLLGAAVTTGVVALAVAMLWRILVAAATGGGEDVAAEPSASDDVDGRAVVAFLVGAALFVPNVLAYCGGAVLGGSVGAQAQGDMEALSFDVGPVTEDRSVGLLAGGLPPAAYVVPLVFLVIAVVIGARAALQDHPRADRLTGWWRVGVVHAALWAVLAFLTTAFARVEGTGGLFGGGASGEGETALGLGLASTVLTAFGWGAAATVLGRGSVRQLAATYPIAASRVGGARTHPRWRLLLADAVARAERPMPRSLHEAHAALIAGDRPDVEPLPVLPVRGRRVAWLAGGVIAFAIALVVTHQVLSTTVFGPRRAVAAYFEALEDRDALRALEHVDRAGMDESTAALLKPDVLREAAVDWRMGEVKVEGESATVSATVEGRRSEFTLRRDGRAAGIFPRWRLVAPFDELNIDSEGIYGAPVEGFTVNGVDMPATDGGVLVFPGRYAIKPVTSYPWEAQESEVVATGGNTVTATPQVSLAADVPARAEQAVREFVDQCAASTSAQPEGCPFSYGYYELSQVEWTVVSYPTVSVTAGGTGELWVSSDDYGQVSIRAVDEDSIYGREEVEEEESFIVNGSLTFDSAANAVFEPQGW